MSARLLFYVMLQAMAAAVGAGLYGAWGALMCCFVAGLTLFALDTLRGARLLRWLKSGEYRVAPLHSGLWGETADRIRRLVRDLKQEHRRSEDRLQGFLDAIQSSPVGVALLDDVGQIAWCNQTACVQLGLQMPRDLGQWIGNLVRHPDFTDYYASQHHSREVTFESRPQRGQWLKVSVQVHPYSEGRRLLLSRDVTALEQADAMRRDFVANVSHEIRTPLTVLSGFIETLQTLPLTDAERVRYLGLMSSQAARMQTLVSDLLTLSKLEGSPVPSQQEWHSLPALMHACEGEARALSQTFSTAAHEPAHRLRFDEAPRVEVSGNASEWHSAIANLIANAIRYTAVGGAIQVSWAQWAAGDPLPFGWGEEASREAVRILAPMGVQSTAKRWLLAVRDEGPGIDAEHLPRLTERFYRVDRSRSRESGGTGLGLAIVKHVLQRHGAELVIHSALGQGSVFGIVFPANRIRDLRPSG